MNQLEHLGKILPVDGYRVTLTNSLPSDYLPALIHLYQPLIGMEAINLYQTLLCEAMLEPVAQKEQTHHTLMNYLNISLPKIYAARLKLEAIGLLNTYRRELESMTLYTYELLPPFSPREFFNDFMLAELLYRQIGETKFTQLQQFYQKRNDEQVGENITASFNDVFTTFQPATTRKITPQASEHFQRGIQTEVIEVTWLEQLLKRRKIAPHKILTEENVRIISQLKQLYDLEMYELESALLWALTEDNELDIQQLKAACHDIFTGKYNVSSLKLTYKEIEKEQEKAPATKPKSQKERLIEHLESITPKQLLEDLSAGHNASEQDMKIISDIMVKQGLPIPVMNVLVYYVLLQSNMKLSRQYMEKIAGHWSRAKLTTAREAMEFALRQFQNQPKPSARKQYGQKNHKEVIPDWFNERKEKKSSSKATTLSEEELKKQREMEAILAKYMNKN